MGPNGTPQTVMLGGIPPSIQYGRRLWASNLPLPLMIGEWSWGVLIYVDIEKYTRICLLRNHSLWSGRMTEFYVRGITGWCWVEVSKRKGDAGWKFGWCCVETVWGSKKTAKISKLGVCKQYILQQQREQKSSCVVYPLGYISTYKVWGASLYIYLVKRLTYVQNEFNLHNKHAAMQCCGTLFRRYWIMPSVCIYTYLNAYK